METKNYQLPVPMRNAKEIKLIEECNERYNKYIQPGIVAKTTQKIKNSLPDEVQNLKLPDFKKLSEQEVFTEAIRIATNSFGKLLEFAAKYSISTQFIIRRLNKFSSCDEIDSLDEVCLLRAYEIKKAVNNYKGIDMGAALVEGGVTAAAGIPGIAFNLVLSTFLYYRAVQTVAMFYGYDVKNDAEELRIAANVCLEAISPNVGGAEESMSVVGKVLVMSKAAAIQQMTANNKTWVEIASHGGIELLAAQIRALGNKGVAKSLERANIPLLEKNIFTDLLTQIGKKLGKKQLGKIAWKMSIGISGLLDFGQMTRIIEFADIFYCK